MLKEQTKRRAYDLGFEAYLDSECHDNPFSRYPAPPSRVDKLDDLAHEWAQGYSSAEREARIELRHARSLRV